MGLVQCPGPEENKKVEKGRILGFFFFPAWLLSWDTGPLLPLGCDFHHGLPGSWASGLRLNDTTVFPGVSSLQEAAGANAF